MPLHPPLVIDPSVFAPEAVPDDARELNRAILDRLSKAPDIWAYSLPEIRTARAAGRGSFPLLPPDPDAISAQIEGRHGQIGLRILHPKSRLARGVYLHFHGGGWVMGTARENDARLRRLAEATGLTTISVDYRLAPEAPYPMGPDDCESAALWLIGEGGADFDRSFLAIGGESAGAHLAVLSLLRLRDRHAATPFDAALLTAGCYDLSLTPSVRNWGSDKLILNTRDVGKFVENFLREGEDPADPAISPLYAKLHGLPPALFTCGTADLLLDDTLFMAARWASAGNRAEIDLHAGGCHVFQAFETAQASASLARMEAFLDARIEEKR